MDKIATLVKEAEVRGVLAGLVDAGHIKVASYEDLESLTCAVASCLPDREYDLDDVLYKTAEVLDYLDADEGLDKEAEEYEVDETAVMAAIGELSMMKMAGEIDEETFDKEASSLVTRLGMQGRDLWNKGTQAAKRGFTAESARLRHLAGRTQKHLGARMDRLGEKALNRGKGVAKATKHGRTDLAASQQAKRDKALGALGKLQKRYQDIESAKPSVLRSIAEPAIAYGVPAALAAGAAYGSKKLYDKYKK